MSLISEGLRKAQLEAMRQDREQRRSYMGPGRTDVPPRSGGALMIGAAALGGALIALGGAVYMQRLKSASVVQPPPIVATAKPAVVKASAAAIPVAVQEPKKVAVAQKKPAPVESAAIKPAPSVKKPVRMAEETRASAANEHRVASAAVTVPEASAASSEAGRERTHPPRRDNLVNEKTYMSPMVGPGGAEIALTGISSSRGQSVAILNGNVVREGSVIGPFVVERIEPTRVALRYIDIRVYLTY